MLWERETLNLGKGKTDLDSCTDSSVIQLCDLGQDPSLLRTSFSSSKNGNMGIDIPANTTQWGVWHLVGTHLMLVKLGFWRASNEVVDGQVIRKKDQRQTQSPALLSWSLTLSSSSSIWRQQIRSPLPSHQAPSAAKETGERFINHLG